MINKLYTLHSRHKEAFSYILGAVAQWYSQRTSVLEVAGSTPAAVIVELL